MTRAVLTISSLLACSTAVSGQTFDIGSYEGQWDNLTFLSTGAASALVEDLGGGTLGITIDLDGNVFGQGDPGPLSVTGTLAGDAFTLTAQSDPTFGDIMGGVDELGNLSVDLMDAANGAFELVTLRGTAIGGSIQFDYEIYTQAGAAAFAVGEVNVRLVPAGPSVALLAMGGLVATRRRR